ncbi:hypothetical protein SLEP1_g26049 [Rubroshorea leprosula]|uniref:Uncharacterized protein n=1 Tax=Rubroshorea leprosula TaxID=152421 RepID=A0AAV5JRZ2_9ROSI|nr:hypothetical protein SLEP1_g26049 [Rubroshorea leprosula]
MKTCHLLLQEKQEKDSLTTLSCHLVFPCEKAIGRMSFKM